MHQSCCPKGVSITDRPGHIYDPGACEIRLGIRSKDRSSNSTLVPFRRSSYISQMLLCSGLDAGLLILDIFQRDQCGIVHGGLHHNGPTWYSARYGQPETDGLE